MKIVCANERETVGVVEVNGKYHCIAMDRKNGQVYSIGPDNPDSGGQWFGKWSDAGVRYVSHGLSRSAAMARFRKLS